MTQQMDDLILPRGYDKVPADYTGQVFLESQMREYAKKVVAAERERLLDILKEMHMKTHGSHNYYLHAAVHLRKQLTR